MLLNRSSTPECNSTSMKAKESPHLARNLTRVLNTLSFPNSTPCPDAKHKSICFSIIWQCCSINAVNNLPPKASPCVQNKELKLWCNQDPTWPTTSPQLWKRIPVHPQKQPPSDLMDMHKNPKSWWKLIKHVQCFLGQCITGSTVRPTSTMSKAVASETILMVCYKSAPHCFLTVWIKIGSCFELPKEAADWCFKIWSNQWRNNSLVVSSCAPLQSKWQFVVKQHEQQQRAYPCRQNLVSNETICKTSHTTSNSEVHQTAKNNHADWNIIFVCAMHSALTGHECNQSNVNTWTGWQTELWQSPSLWTEHQNLMSIAWQHLKEEEKRKKKTQDTRKMNDNSKHSKSGCHWIEQFSQERWAVRINSNKNASNKHQRKQWTWQMEQKEDNEKVAHNRIQEDTNFTNKETSAEQNKGASVSQHKMKHKAEEKHKMIALVWSD